MSQYAPLVYLLGQPTEGNIGCPCEHLKFGILTTSPDELANVSTQRISSAENDSN
jgi:hypothetical protein